MLESVETDQIQILGASCADAPFPPAAEHRGGLRYTIDNKPFFACSCREDGPVRLDDMAALADMAAHYRMVGA